MTEFSVRVERQASRGFVVDVVGELDASTAPQVELAFREELVGDAVPECIVNLSGVTFIDSSGLSVLVIAHRLAGVHGATMLLVSNPLVDRVLRIAGLDGHFGIVPERQQ